MPQNTHELCSYIRDLECPVHVLELPIHNLESTTRDLENHLPKKKLNEKLKYANLKWPHFPSKNYH